MRYGSRLRKGRHDVSGLRPAALRAELFDPAAWQQAVRNRAVILTGGAGGLGRAVVHELMAAGALVTVVDRPGADMTDFARRSNLVAVSADITQPQECARVVQEAVSAYGRVDALVNNAGVIHVAVIVEHEIEDWRRVFQVNVEGSFLMAQACIRQMIEQPIDTENGRRGLIVNIGSRAADAGRPFTTAYAASKAAVVHMSMSLAQAFADDQIATTVVFPADIETPMFLGVCQQIADLEGVTLEQFVADRPMDTAESYAPVVMSVLSSQAMEFNGVLVRHGEDDRPFRTGDGEVPRR